MAAGLKGSFLGPPEPECIRRTLRSLSIKQECLERVVPLGEAHLRELVNEYVQHYQYERPHQGLGGELIARQRVCGTGPILTRRRLGGLLNHYERRAA